MRIAIVGSIRIQLLLQSMEVLLVDVDDQRETARKTQLGFSVIMAALFTAALATKIGVVLAVTIAVVVLILMFGGMGWVLSRHLRDERQRRQAGAVPSWSVTIKTSSARRFGFHVPSKMRQQVEAFGRIYCDGSQFWCVPTDRTAKAGYYRAEFRWDYTWPMELHKVWGSGRQGRLIVQLPNGESASLWIRGVDDFSKVAQIALSRRVK